MGNSARKYLNRAPRYVLNAGDEKIVRVASRERRRNQIYQLEIVDLSESGMSFIVNWNYLPQIGEILKVEFPVPGEHRKVAWFARVVRMEGPSERPTDMTHFSGIKVAVEFIDMPKGHIQTLKTGLQKRAKEYYRAGENKLVLFRRTQQWKLIKQILFLFFFTAACAYFFYFITQKNANYDPARPKNWGERFFDRVITK